MKKTCETCRFWRRLDPNDDLSSLQSVDLSASQPEEGKEADLEAVQAVLEELAGCNPF